jgi:hypothetical protein
MARFLARPRGAGKRYRLADPRPARECFGHDGAATAVFRKPGLAKGLPLP